MRYLGKTVQISIVGALCAIGLSACGGMSAESRTIADACIDMGSADKSVCKCFAREAAKRLSNQDLQTLAELMTDTTGMRSLDFALEAGSSDTGDLMRFQNSTARAMEACS